MSLLTDVQACISTIVSKCYPLTAPDLPVPPFAIYNLVSKVPSTTVSSGISIDNSSIQIDIFAKTYAEAHSLADQVRVAIMNIGGIPTSYSDMYESEVKIYRVSQDFSFWH